MFKQKELQMESKKWYLSKTIWTAIIAGVIGVLEAFGISIPPQIITILVAFGLYSLRVATTGIK